MAKTVEDRLTAIEARNSRVEQDKAWETSWTRRISIAVLTYAVVAAYLVLINDERPFIVAVVPAAGFLLSTLVMGQIRNIWTK